MPDSGSRGNELSLLLLDEVNKLVDMLMGHADALSEHRSSKDQLLSGPESELDDDETSDSLEQILYAASFEELARNTVKYDTVIWFSISLLLILAWGIGIIMLLYLPFRRYVLQKDFASRKLYVTPTEIVYKVSRPSFVPFWGIVTIEKHIALSLVIDIIIEQGCLQSKYEIHTFRIESIAHGKAAPVDELLIQGISKPGVLRKVIMREATKAFQDRGKTLKPNTLNAEVDRESVARMLSFGEGPTIFKSPSKRAKSSVMQTGSPRYVATERRSVLSQERLLQKLEEVNKSVKKLEVLIEKAETS